MAQGRHSTLKIFYFHPLWQYSDFSLHRVSRQFFRRDLIVGVQFSGAYRQPCRQVSLYVKGILFVKIRKVFIIRVFCNIVLPGEERAHAPDLQEAFSPVHHGQLVHAHKVYATLSSDEFNFYKKYCKLSPTIVQ